MNKIKVIIIFRCDFDNGQNDVIQNVILFCFYPEHRTPPEWIEDLSLRCLVLGVAPPSGLEVTMRQAADGMSFTFILNCTHKTVGIELTNMYQDIWNGESVSGDIMFTPHQVRILVRDNS